jgi:hypothetical protein
VVPLGIRTIVQVLDFLHELLELVFSKAMTGLRKKVWKKLERILAPGKSYKVVVVVLLVAGFICHTIQGVTEASVFLLEPLELGSVGGGRRSLLAFLRHGSFGMIGKCSNYSAPNSKWKCGVAVVMSTEYVGVCIESTSRIKPRRFYETLIRTIEGAYTVCMRHSHRQRDRHSAIGLWGGKLINHQTKGLRASFDKKRVSPSDKRRSH